MNSSFVSWIFSFVLTYCVFRVQCFEIFHAYRKFVTYFVKPVHYVSRQYNLIWCRNVTGRIIDSLVFIWLLQLLTSYSKQTKQIQIKNPSQIMRRTELISLNRIFLSKARAKIKLGCVNLIKTHESWKRYKQRKLARPENVEHCTLPWFMY